MVEKITVARDEYPVPSLPLEGMRQAILAQSDLAGPAQAPLVLLDQSLQRRADLRVGVIGETVDDQDGVAEGAAGTDRIAAPDERQGRVGHFHARCLRLGGLTTFSCLLPAAAP